MLLLGTPPCWLPHPGSCCCLKYASSCPPPQRREALVRGRRGQPVLELSCAHIRARQRGWLEMETADPIPRICHLLYCLSACWETCPSAAARAASVCAIAPCQCPGFSGWGEDDAEPQPGAKEMLPPALSPQRGLVCSACLCSSLSAVSLLTAPMGVRTLYGILYSPCGAEVGTMGGYCSITPQHP